MNTRYAVLAAFAAAALSWFSAASALGDESTKLEPKAVSESRIPHLPPHAGGTGETLGAPKDPKPGEKNAKLFSEVERATLALTREMTRNIVVSDATMNRIRAALSDQEVVELIGTISGHNMVSRFLIATGIELEQ